MYTGDNSSSVSQGNTKSTIQALLKNREHRPAAKSLPANSSQDKIVLPNYSHLSEYSDLGTIPTNLEFDTKSQFSPEHIATSSNIQENSEHQKDFNYSQKLFHIADGNLYSIFSPIQGRSYGMKPSFLRKQKYTVQECHSRGRKNLRKGLKFHNFLPSESVTSEKDNRYLNTKWKVHSECRLREEHGTKQITISNWSQSIQNPPEESNYAAKNSISTTPSATETNSTEISSHPKDEDNGPSNDEQNVNDPYDFNLCLQQQMSAENSDAFMKFPKIRTETAQSSSATAVTSKKDSLDLVLNSLIEKPSLLEKRNNCSDEIEAEIRSFQKHRRKPVQTRRIVPYVKYLSIIEENESLPLDLSSKCLIDNSSSPSPSSSDELPNISGKKDIDFVNFPVCDKNSNSSSVVSLNENLQLQNAPNDKIVLNSVPDKIMRTQISTPVAVLYPMPFNKSSSLGQNGFLPTAGQIPSSSKVDANLNQSINNSLNVSIDKPYNFLNQPFPHNSNFSVQKSFIKEVQSKPRRRNQRSVIKQKLEDTFRQNGFLVKTKQVSDGEATFCKFRQLRKYTRYYLKSLEQHLPDEFHKMWKGFLPPKTVLPPVLGSSESTNENL